MSLDGRTVDQHLLRRATRCRQRMENGFPNTFSRPADEAVVERLARTIDRRSIDPAAAGFKNMNNPTDDTPVVYPGFAARVGRKMRLKPRKLSVTQPKIVSIHWLSPSEALNHKFRMSQRHFMGPGARGITIGRENHPLGVSIARELNLDHHPLNQHLWMMIEYIFVSGLLTGPAL